MKIVRGVPASLGIAIAPVAVYKGSLEPVKREVFGDPVAAVNSSFEEVKRQIKAILERPALSKSESEILEAQLMFLEDESLLNEVRERLNAGLDTFAAISESFDKFIDALSRSKNEYMRERAEDLQDLKHKVLLALSGEAFTPPAHDYILVATLLGPSEFAELVLGGLKGVVLEAGGINSHVAIMARERGVPMIIGAHGATSSVKDGDSAILDAVNGYLYVEPTEAYLSKFKVEYDRLVKFKAELSSMAKAKAVTLDGAVITVEANAGGLDDLGTALAYGADGVGLLRTEFLYLGRMSPPPLEELMDVFGKFSVAFEGKEVIVRTLDVGGDKFPQYMSLEKEDNPFLGVRGLRLSLKSPDIFRQQIKAVLAANKAGNLKIMLPMVSLYEEVEAAAKIKAEVEEEAKREGIAIKGAELGIMVETPSAALMTDRLSEVSDFFSIGSNDLAQYVLAADRTNSNVATIYDDLHPSVLRAIKIALERSKKPVGLCGELGGNLLALPVLIGIGLRKLSMPPPRIPIIKAAIKRIKASEAKEVAEQALNAKDGVEVRNIAKKYLESVEIPLL